MEWLNSAKVFMIGVGGAIMTSIFKDEIVAWLPKATAWMIELAAKRMPLEEQDQCREEWSAHVSEYTGNLAPTYQALSILIAAGRSKPWTVGRALRYLANIVFLFQIYNAYYFASATFYKIESGYFEEYAYIRSFLCVVNFYVLVICVRVNLRDVRASFIKSPEGVYNDEVTLREAAIVTKWAVTEAVKRRFRG